MSDSRPHTPDFEILKPEVQAYPVVFNSPHSGSFYRDDFIAASRLELLNLRKSEDSFVDQLFDQMPGLGCPLLKANFPRAFLDVNRGPWELDPKMFVDRLPDYVETKTLRVFNGLGTIARNVSEAETIYTGKMTFEEARNRIERYYFPYHQALQGLFDATRDRFGQVLLIDCHSMPSCVPSCVPSSVAGLIKSRLAKPDIVLGDRHGSACSAVLIDQLEHLLKTAGLKTGRNKPYAGGYITQAYGRPKKGRSVIQLEINRGLYMDEKTISKNQNFDGLRDVLSGVFSKFMQTAQFNTESGCLAAE